MRKYPLGMAAILFFASFGVMGCATEDYVNRHVAKSLEARVGELTDDVTANRKIITANRNEITKMKSSIAAVSSNVRDALQRAEKAGKLAEGKFLYEATISDASVGFAFDVSELAEDALPTLDVIAGELNRANPNAYLEIQGHTDSSGTERYNLELGEERAKSVSRYLHTKHNIRLHRMRAFSYGESKMVAGNDTEEDRAQNRRVTIVVMQ